MRKVAYAGAPRPKCRTAAAAIDRRPDPADLQPVGMSGVAFLRRVKDAPEGYRVFRRSDRMIFGRVLTAGYIAALPRHADTVRLTSEGAAFLDRLMRVE
ncbi:hypothetical protein [Sinorhizobium fredii]|uniref:hypothetical protein n=1 Tax=Rhizobium fredii TaxID=380 RepID=UPI0004ACBB26|nr:hypothetical protein [Sinorhizobium fredii]ASY68872.1 hypothetical protein SF83666_c14510 [Sinorhizobium fredii CCBAU 83666]